VTFNHSRDFGQFGEHFFIQGCHRSAHVLRQLCPDLFHDISLARNDLIISMAQQYDAYTYEAVYNLLSFKNNMIISQMSEHTLFIIKKNVATSLHFTSFAKSLETFMLD